MSINRLQRTALRGPPLNRSAHHYTHLGCRFWPMSLTGFSQGLSSRIGRSSQHGGASLALLHPCGKDGLMQDRLEAPVQGFERELAPPHAGAAASHR